MFAALAIAAGLLTQPQPTTIPEMWDAWCARCHAPDGSGKVQEPTITVEPMDFTECRLTTPEPDADWALAISHGGPAVGLSSEMPAFGDAVSAEYVEGFISHIRRFCKEPGWPSGNANFPRPIFTEKAFPENEFVLLPAIAHRSSATDVGFSAVYERRLGKRAMWEVTLPVASNASEGSSRARGIGDVEVEAKYVLAVGSATPRILSAGLEVALPTGSESLGLGHGTPIFEPYLAAGTVVRNTYLQAQTKVELPADTTKADRAFVYHLYAGRDISMSPDTWTYGIELSGENDELALTPQLRKGLTKTGALGASIGVRLPLNERQEQGTSVVGYLLWEYLEPVRARR